MGDGPGVEGAGEDVIVDLGVPVALAEFEDIVVTRPSQASGEAVEPNKKAMRGSPLDLGISVFERCVRTSIDKSKTTVSEMLRTRLSPCVPSESSARRSNTAATAFHDC